MLRRTLILGLFAAGACAPSPSPARPGAGGRSPVVVTIVVDQLAAWVAAERVPLLPANGGFARLVREGTYVTAMRYEHAVTDTAPGHSALYTGATPSVSGIFANEVPSSDGKAVSILLDPAVSVVTSDGVEARPGSSLAALRVETLADRLRAERPDAFIVSLSLKDRGALFGAGRHPSAALWFDIGANRFVTSTAVAPAFPAWAGAATSLVREAEASTWTLLDPAWVASHALTPDDEAGEGDVSGFGRVFPHPLARSSQPARAFRTSPESDDVLLDLALRAASQAGQRETLIAVSLSANDYIGHTFGPDSWEAWDEIERLDASLARFFSGLDRIFGERGYAVLLTGDHGITPMPETGRHAYCDRSDPWNRACGAAARVFPADLARVLESSARDALGPGNWIAGVADPLVYVTPAARALDPPRKAALSRALEKTLLATPGVGEVWDVHAFDAGCGKVDDSSPDESERALVCRSVSPAAIARGAAFYVAVAPGSFFDPTVVVGKGTSHGSPYLYDRTVPLFVRAPGRVAAGRTVPSATFTMFARTAALLLGIAPPHDAAPGAALGE